MKGKYLITTTEWFYAPDGKQYRAVWGEVELLNTKDVLGVDPNRVTANWMLRIGSEENHILIGGCQINYSVKCNTRPSKNPVEQIFEGEKRVCEPAIFIPSDIESDEIDEIEVIEVIEGKEVIWQKGKNQLLNLILSLPLEYFSSMESKENIIRRIYDEGFKRFRFWRPTYSRYSIIEIQWLTGNIESLQSFLK